jgi:hypothetical protein
MAYLKFSYVYAEVAAFDESKFFKHKTGSVVIVEPQLTLSSVCDAGKAEYQQKSEGDRSGSHLCFK